MKFDGCHGNIKMIGTQLTNQNLCREWRYSYWKFQPHGVNCLFKTFKKPHGGLESPPPPPPLVRPRVKTVLSSLIFALQIKLQVEVFFKSSSLNVIFKLSRSFRRSYLVTTICSCLLEIISQLWLRITFNSPTISDVTELLVSQSWSVSQSVGGSVGQSVPIHSFIRSSVRPSIHPFIYAFIYSRFSRRLQKHPLPANSIS